MQSKGVDSGASFSAGGLPCLQCGQPLPPRALACPLCGTLVFRERLQQLANEAARQEWTDPRKAALIWRQCLGLLPVESEQYRQVADRATALAEGAVPIPGSVPAESSPPALEPSHYRRQNQRSPETLASILLKTGGSMAFSMWVYQHQAGWGFAIGFVLLILVHELGHVVANWFYRIAQSPPVFLPYVGALILLRQNPPNAKAEAVTGIAGPIAGSVATMVCFGWFVQTGSSLAAALAAYGAFMNLFNLLPCPPMDGGRVTAAISPLLWIPGALAFAAFIIYIGLNNGGGWGGSTTWIIGIWIFMSAFQRVRVTLAGGQWRLPYYRVDWLSRVSISIALLGLIGVLVYVLRMTYPYILER